jgi:mono/diheme cytochrome c family protein
MNYHRSVHRVGGWLVSGLVLALLPWGILAAVAQDGDAPERLARGRRAFQIHCMNCHGDGGKGDGPMVEVLRVPPTDLTRLTEAAGGTFPTDAIYRAIDGREEILGHGRRQMPVWGLTFQELGRDTSEEKQTEERILDLIFFLRMIQEPVASEPGREP